MVGVVSSVFWGAIVLSALVFVHEGGHFLAARACGVRVSEFFLGLPCRFRLRHVSRRNGTVFGVTPLLLGGYAMICGMEPVDDELAPAVLAAVHRAGRISVADLAQTLGIDEERALGICAALMGWGSLAGWYDPAKGEREGGKYYPTTYESVPRDANGLTVLDGRAFDRAHATAQGEPWEPPAGEAAFFEQERGRTYQGQGFWKRALMLVAGIAVNLVTGFALLVAAYSVVGVEVALNTSVIGGVEPGSIAEGAGLAAGDEILSVDGTETPTWESLVGAIASAQGTGEVELSFEHDGEQRRANVDIAEGEMLGITASTEVVRLGLVDSASTAWSYIVETARTVGQLLVPSQTLQVLDNSTSIVGISVMSAEAAAAGPLMLMTFMALISFSLGMMNLLPIPPLDGGKLLIELIQAVTRRRVPMAVQTALSLVGVGLFALLFIYMLRIDILRFI